VHISHSAGRPVHTAPAARFTRRRPPGSHGAGRPVHISHFTFHILHFTFYSQMIFHSVFLKLKHAAGTIEEKQFLAAAQKLANIPGVRNFQVLKQTSVKNNFEFGLLMEFVDQDTYDAYSNHEEHVQFLQLFWMNDVEDFLEIDYEHIKM
jgi:heme-degrading monooxygenase HmoA